MIDLARNEARVGPPREVIARVAERAAGCLHRYPARLHAEVLAEVAERFALPGEEALLTRGVDEAVDLVLGLCPERRPVLLRPEFVGFGERLAAAGRSFLGLAFPSRWSFPVEAAAALGSEHLFLVSSPHNPTGEDFEPDALQAIAESGTLVLLDRAYRDFAHRPDAHERSPHPRILRFYSFSKAFGLAGQRAGVLVGPAALLGPLRTRQWHLHLDAFTLLLLREVLGGAWRDENVRRTVAARESLLRTLAAEGFDVHPSQASFVLLRATPAEGLIAHLAEGGIAVAPTAPLGLDGHVRITVGSDEERGELLAGLRTWAGGAGDDGG